MKASRTAKTFCSAQGFSAVELLVSAAILALIVGGGLLQLSKMLKSSNSIRQARDAQSLIASLRRAASSNPHLRQSLTVATNSALRNCLPSAASPTGPCNATSDQNFELFFRGRTIASGASPVRYTVSGQRCGTLVTNCPIAVKATFRARCASGNPSCRVAESVRTRLTVTSPSSVFTSTLVVIEGAPQAAKDFDRPIAADLALCQGACGNAYPRSVGQFVPALATASTFALPTGCAGAPVLVSASVLPVQMCTP